MKNISTLALVAALAAAPSIAHAWGGTGHPGCQGTCSVGIDNAHGGTFTAGRPMPRPDYIGKDKGKSNTQVTGQAYKSAVGARDNAEATYGVAGKQKQAAFSSLAKAEAKALKDGVISSKEKQEIAAKEKAYNYAAKDWLTARNMLARANARVRALKNKGSAGTGSCSGGCGIGKDGGYRGPNEAGGD
jgi:hypothetical protein